MGWSARSFLSSFFRFGRRRFARRRAKRRRPNLKKEDRNERADQPICHGFGQSRWVAARVELAGRRFARLCLGGIENLPRQIARAASPGLAIRPDRRRRDADSERRCSKSASASTEQQSAELCGRASKDCCYE